MYNGRISLRVTLPSFSFTLWTITPFSLCNLYLRHKFYNKYLSSKNFWIAKMQIWRLHRSLTMMLIPPEAATLPQQTQLPYIFSLLYDRWAIAYSSKSGRNLWTNYIYFWFTDSVVSLSLSPRHGPSSRWGWRYSLQTWKVAVNTRILINSPDRSQMVVHKLCVGTRC